MSEKKSFWTTLPGILTGAAAVVTATGGLLLVLYQIGVIWPEPEPEPTPGPTSEPEPTERPTDFRIGEVFLRADPFDHVGPCPVTITFSGRISVVSGSGTVSYKFLRSDGASAPIETLTFDGPGSRNVSDTWTLGAATPTFDPYDGWEAIKIFEPQEIESDKAHFTMRCR